MNWSLGLALIVTMTIGIAGCSKEDVITPQPQPPTPENPDTPEPIIPVADSSKKPFDPSKPYKPINKILQVFKYGYPVKIIDCISRTELTDGEASGSSSDDPIIKEYILDENNNLVKIIVDGEVQVEFEYGKFTDQMGNIYQVKYIEHSRYTFNGEVKDEPYINLCRLNDSEMVVDQYIPVFEGGYHYEYDNNRIIKITHYSVDNGRKIDDGLMGNYKWESNNLMEYTNWYIDGRHQVNPLEYPNKELMKENRSCLFSLFNSFSYCGIDNTLFMAALLGQPSQYLPSSYHDITFKTPCYITNIEFDDDGLPVNAELSTTINEYNLVKSDHVQYVWRKIIR